MTIISDTVAQAFTATLDGVPFSCDSMKTFRLIVWAFFGLAPATHFWNRAMEYSFDGWSMTPAVVGKTLLDQTLFTLWCNVCTIIVVNWAERKPLSQVPGRLRACLWLLLKANWKVWGPTMLLVYAFVEEDLRPLVINFVSIGWQIFYLMLLRPPSAASKDKDIEEGVELAELLEPEVHTALGDRNAKSTSFTSLEPRVVTPGMVCSV